MVNDKNLVTEKFSYFIDNLEMPKDTGARRRLIAIASRKNRYAS
jgi:hypothetical protein